MCSRSLFFPAASLVFSLAANFPWQIAPRFLFYKITRGFINVNPSIVPVVCSTRPTRYSTNNFTKYLEPKCKTVTYQKSYLIIIWNNVTDELNLCVDRLKTFKDVMSKYYFSAISNYDCNNLHTAHLLLLSVFPLLFVYFQLFECTGSTLAHAVAGSLRVSLFINYLSICYYCNVLSVGEANKTKNKNK